MKIKKSNKVEFKKFCKTIDYKKLDFRVRQILESNSKYIARIPQNEVKQFSKQAIKSIYFHIAYDFKYDNSKIVDKIIYILDQNNI